VTYPDVHNSYTAGSSSRVRTWFVAALLAAAALAAAPTPAPAAQYTVQQCVQGVSHNAEFLAPTNRPDAFYWQNKCAAGGGFLIAGTWAKAVQSGDGITAITFAPDGTRFVRLEASFSAYTTTGMLARGDACQDTWCTSTTSIFLGLSNFPARDDRNWAGGAAALRFQLVCTGIGSPYGCGWGVGPLLEIFEPRFTLVDSYLPAAQATGGALVSGSWKRGVQSLQYHASDRGGGVALARLKVDGVAHGQHAPACARAADGSGLWAKLVPCPSAVDAPISVDLSRVPDGAHQALIEVQDAAGQAGASAPFPLKVDNTPPAPPGSVAIDGGGGWRSDPRFSVAWENPVEEHAPIAAARWRLCPVAGGVCTAGRAAGRDIARLDGLSTQREGEYELAVWLEDEAGNQDPARGRVARIRVDGTAPALSFDEHDPGDPTRVSVSSSDSLSGLADGEIEMRRIGGAAWHPLETSVSREGLTAYVDDERFERGEYEFRAFGTDAAGNQTSTNRRASGAAMLLRLPVRVVTRLSAGVRRKRPRGHRLSDDVRVRLGRAVTVVGRLRNADGQPIDDAELQVLSSTRLAPDRFQLSGLVRTDEEGRFSYRLAPRESRLLHVRYPGSRRIRGAGREVVLRVPADSTLRASDRRVVAGETVTFRGRLKTRPVPPGGKLVEIQSFFRERWRTFSTVRTDGAGRWSFTYGFTGTVGTVRYRFRARIPFEGGYGYDTGHSRPRTVLVRGL